MWLTPWFSDMWAAVLETWMTLSSWNLVFLQALNYLFRTLSPSAICSQDHFCILRPCFMGGCSALELCLLLGFALWLLCTRTPLNYHSAGVFSHSTSSVFSCKKVISKMNHWAGWGTSEANSGVGRTAEFEHESWGERRSKSRHLGAKIHFEQRRGPGGL